MVQILVWVKVSTIESGIMWTSC